MIRKNLWSPVLFVFTAFFACIGAEKAENSPVPKQEECCLFLSDSGPVVSQRTDMQNRLTLWHDHVAKMLKSEEEMKKEDLPPDAKYWMRLMLTDGLDFAVPKPVVCLWDNRGEKKKNCLVEVSEDKDFQEGVMRFAPENGKNFLEVHSLKIGKKYFLRLLWEEEGAGKYSQMITFTTATELPRWIRVDGVSNVRDFGGWKTADGKRVRQGLFFRGPELNGKIAASAKGLSMLLENLKIRTDIDLRGAKSEKRPANGTPAFPVEKAQFHHFPLGAYGGIFSAKQRELCKGIFRILLDERNLPAYIHCVGGADRTGTIIFLLQGVLKVPEEEMLRDYELTSMFAAYRGIRYRGRKAFLAFRKALREKTGEEDLHKQCEKYFLDSGVTANEIAAFRKLFLEE